MRKNLIRKFPLLAFISMCIIIISARCALADNVKLKNGREFQGRLKQVTDTDVVIELRLGESLGTVGFKIADIESINNLSIEEARARLSTEGAFISGEKKQAVSASAQEGLNFVSKTRKLEFKSTPAIETVGKDKIKAYIKESIDKLYSQEKLDTKAKILLKLGLISKIEDYNKEVLGLLVEEVAGYYNTDDKKIYVSGDVTEEILPGLPSITIMHEQVHALQDQYFDLKKIEDTMLSENEDKGLAMQSIVEGEATVLMYDAFFRSVKGLGMPETKEFDLRTFVVDSMLAYSKHLKNEQGQSAIFMEDLLFPYVWGGSFIQHLVNTKGWEEINTIYKDMPVSSEQIMHPEKYYIMRDEPQKVDFIDLSNILGSSWVKLSEDTLGEFSFYLIGKAFLDELSAKVMSEGWGGDCYELYEEANSKKTLLLILSKWDNERDADEFLSLYKKIIGKKYKEATLVKEDSNSSQWKIDEDNVYISKSKDSVFIIEGAPDTLLASLIVVLTN